MLYTDASDMAIGAVLSQFQDSLTKLERNYSTIERVGAVREFYPYLYGFQFKLATDHNPPTPPKDPKDVCGRLTRWMLYLQQFTS